MNSNWSYSPETHNLGQIRQFLKPCDFKTWRMTLKITIGYLFYATSSFVHHFVGQVISWSHLLPDIQSTCSGFKAWICNHTNVEMWSLIIHPWPKFNSNKANLRDLIAATRQVISNWIQIINFFARVTVKFDGWPRKTIGHFFYTMSSFVHHFKSIGEFKLDLQSRNAQFGSTLVICYPVWPWNLMDDLGKQ